MKTMLLATTQSKQNAVVYVATQLLHSLMFTIPVWIVFYQSRISVWEISFLVTLQYAVQMILELPSGALADMIGRKSTAILAFVIGAVGFLAFPWAVNLLHFSLIIILVGASDAFRSGSEEALLYDSFKQANNETGYSKTYNDGNLIYQVGLITGTALGGYLYSYNNVIPFVAYGIMLLFASILSLFYIEPKLDTEKFSLSGYKRQITEGVKEAFKSRYTTYLSLYYIAVGGIAWASTVYFNDYMLIELGFADSTRGVITAALRLINALVVAKVLTNTKLFNSTRTILFFPIIMLFAYLPALTLQGYWGLPFVQAAMIATTARWGILSPLTNEMFSSKYRATAISLLSLLIGFVFIGLTAISGLVITLYGIRVMYMTLGIVSAITIVPLAIKLINIQK
ncbi:MAG: MFS transporter [Patescibacteria group bacterium]